MKNPIDFRILTAIIAALSMLSECSPREKSVANISESWDQYFTRQFPSGEPGGAVLVLKDDSVLFSKGYGLADIHTRERISSKTLFNLGSISKTFVAHAILQLQEQGKLSLEDSLAKFFPGFKNKSIARQIKIKHLLTHTSGLPDNRQVSNDTAFYLTAKDAENWYPVTQADALEFEPGSQFRYSNPAYNGLALIVEQVVKMPWQQYVEENMLKPAGMTTSTITNGPHPQQGVAHAYVNNHGKWTEDDYGEEPTFAAAGNGGVWSSVEELGRYHQALVNHKLLKPETFADAIEIKTFDNWIGTFTANVAWSWHKPTKKNANGTIQPFIGWSWFIGETPNGLKTVGHTGSQGGFLCNYVSIPEKKILVVILCNTPRDINAQTEFVLSAIEQGR
ncbi:MAG: serine hydrolase domain-containing protein [Bacteroidota bacterium]